MVCIPHKALAYTGPLCWDCGMVGVVIIALVALLCYVSFYTLMSDVLIIRRGYARSKREHRCFENGCNFISESCTACVLD